MSIQPTPVLPKSAFFEVPSTVVPSRKYELRAQPVGNTVLTSSGQTCKIVLGQSQMALFNFQTAYLLFTVTYTQTGAGVVETDKSFVLGSGYSHFSRQVIRQNGQVLETIENPGILQNMVTSMVFRKNFNV